MVKIIVAFRNSAIATLKNVSWQVTYGNCNQTLEILYLGDLPKWRAPHKTVMIVVAVMHVHTHITVLSTSILNIKCAQNYFATKQKRRLVIPMLDPYNWQWPSAPSTTYRHPRNTLQRTTRNVLRVTGFLLPLLQTLDTGIITQLKQIQNRQNFNKTMIIGLINVKAAVPSGRAV